MNRFLLALALGSFAASAAGQTTCWHASSGVLPDDPSIPTEHRFALSGQGSFVTLGATLRVLDDVSAEAVYFQKTDLSPITSSEDWEFEVEIQMHSDDREGGALDIGNQVTVRDDVKQISLGVHVNAVGFVNIPADSWVAGQSVSMDASDQLHLYRVVKVGAQVELYIDGAAVPSLVIPYSSFPSTPGSSIITIVGTSIIGISDFEIESYAFRRNAGILDFSICPPLVQDGDTLRMHSRFALPTTPNFLFLISINGTPFILRLLNGSANSKGEWLLDTTAPVGLAGLDLTILQIGFSAHTGRLAVSNTASLLFR